MAPTLQVGDPRPAWFTGRRGPGRERPSPCRCPYPAGRSDQEQSPGQDVEGGVVVGIRRVATRRAVKQCLGLAIPPCPRVGTSHRSATYRRDRPSPTPPPCRPAGVPGAPSWTSGSREYSLLVTQAERAALSSMLDTCTGQPYVPPVQPVQPTPVPPAQATPTPPVSVPQSQYPAPRRQGRYCTDFDTRAQYEAFYAGRKKPDSHDRDRDGHYCEALN